MFVFANNSFAERLLPIDFIGQPQMMLKESNTNACGIRIVGIQSPADISNKSEPIFIADASFMIYRNNIGIVKALISESTVGAFLKQSKNVNPKIFNTFWMKADSHPATAPIQGQAVNGETAGSKIYVTDTDSVINLYSAAMSGETIKLAYKFKDDSKSIILYGKVALSEDDSKQVQSCMNELANMIAKDTLPESAK